MVPLQEREGERTGGAPRTRVIVDDGGRIWTVEQLRAGPTDPIQKASLLFTTENLMRRIRQFPDNWHSLADPELYALSLKP